MTRDIQFFTFIDAENITYKHLEPVFTEILKYGIISGKRAYADWSNPAYKNWPEFLDKLGIRPFQQFHYDADETDKAIIMDILEVVYSNENINGICLIGNDHIYGSIARRVREKGLFFLGIGTEKASQKFVDSCNNFIYINNIASDEINAGDEKKSSKSKERSQRKKLVQLIMKAMDDIEEENVHLSTLSNMLKKMDPAFDSRTYGYKKFMDLISSLGDIITLETDDRKPPVYYVKKK
jgi:hypothetical protein